MVATWEDLPLSSGAAGGCTSDNVLGLGAAAAAAAPLPLFAEPSRQMSGRGLRTTNGLPPDLNLSPDTCYGSVYQRIPHLDITTAEQEQIAYQQLQFLQNLSDSGQDLVGGGGISRPRQFSLPAPSRKRNSQ